MYEHLPQTPTELPLKDPAPHILPSAVVSPPQNLESAPPATDSSCSPNVEKDCMSPLPKEMKRGPGRPKKRGFRGTIPVVNHENVIKPEATPDADTTPVSEDLVPGLRRSQRTRKEPDWYTNS